MRKGFLSFLMLAVLFDNPEGGGGGGDPVRPDTISEDEWQGLSKEEREGVLMDGEGEQGHILEEGNEEELTEEQLAAIAGEQKPADDQAAIDAALLEAEGKTDDKTAEEIAAEAVAAEAAKVPGDITIITDEELLQFRPVVRDSELPISTEVPTELATKLATLE